ncbi:MAG: hypothetical protein MAG453_02161 [Calditrichaeota bacterium]|nr:hypothetical protein [Calditrichota bacterium]
MHARGGRQDNPRSGATRRWTRYSLLVTRYSLIALALLVVHSQAQFPQPGQESYAERAERALVAGDIPSAVELYRMWLEADPGDYVSWYNYACALAIAGDTSLALNALENAVAAGWRDSTWTVNDPNLSSLHSTDRFANLTWAMGRLARLEADSGAAGSVPRYIRQTRLAPYSVLIPAAYDRNSADSYPLVLLLHGRGADMEQMREFAARLALPDVIYALPRAPYAISDGDAGYEYWPRGLARAGDSAATRLSRALAGRWVGDVARRAADDYRVDTTRVFAVGFSQGGAAAVLAALENPGLFHGIASLAGFVPETHRDSTRFRRACERGLFVFIGHGRRDRVIETGEAEAMRDLFRAGGVEPVMKLYPSQHSLPDEMVVDLADWIMETCERARRPEVSADSLDLPAPEHVEY